MKKKLSQTNSKRVLKSKETKAEYVERMWNSVDQETKKRLFQELENAPPVSEKLLEEAFASIESTNIGVNDIYILDDNPEKVLEDLRNFKPKKEKENV